MLELYGQKQLYGLMPSYREMPRYCRYFDTMTLDQVLSTMSDEC